MVISAAILIGMSAAVYGFDNGSDYPGIGEGTTGNSEDTPSDSSFGYPSDTTTSTPPYTGTRPTVTTTTTIATTTTTTTTTTESEITTPTPTETEPPDETDDTTPDDTDTEPPEVYPPEITLSFTERWMTVGDNAQLTAEVINTDEYYPVSFYSSNTGVIIVDAYGYIVAVGAGSAVVTAYSGELEAYAYIYVSEPEAVPEYIVLTEDSFILKIDQTARIQARLLPEEAAVGYELIYESEDPSIAEVDENGVITAVRAGETDIIVAGAGLAETVHVTVSADIAYDTARLDGYLYDDTGKPMAGSHLVIDDISAVTDKNGYFLFESVEQRSLTIKLSDDKDAACGLTVSGNTTVYLLYSPGALTRVGSYEELAGLLAINSVRFISSEVMLTAGEVYELEYLYEPSDANITGISYTSSNSVAAAVGQVDGVVTAKAPGEAVITLILNNGQATAECTITVSPRESSEHSVLIVVIEAAVFAVAALTVLLGYIGYKRRSLDTFEEDDEDDTHDIL